MTKRKTYNLFQRGFGITFSLVFIFQIGFPTFSMALTTGPYQEEYASFEPAGTSDLVDLYTGDFTYNIPLMSVPGPNGGYPINLSYHSGVGMEQEASWVGLGWTLNAGAVNRNTRGLPDDFAGDKVTRFTSMRKMLNVSAEVPIPPSEDGEVFGFPQTGLPSTPYQCNVYFNNYKGVGFRVSYLPSKTFKLTDNVAASVGVGLSYDSQSGIGVEPHMGLSIHGEDVVSNKDGNGKVKESSKENVNYFQTGLGLSYNSREGLTGGNVGGLGFSTSQGVPSVSVPTVSKIQPFTLQFGTAPFFGLFHVGTGGTISGNYMEADYLGEKKYDAYGYAYTFSGNQYAMKDFNRGSQGEYSKKLPNLPSSSFTADNFSYTAQGAGGSFRPYLAGVPVLSDPLVESRTQNLLNLGIPVNGINIPIPTPSGIEVGVTPGPPTNVHIGMDFTLFNGFSRSGGWQGSGPGESTNDVEFADGAGTDLNVNPSNNAGFENVAWTPNNEMNRFLHRFNSNNSNFYDEWHDNEPYRVDLAHNSNSFFEKSFKADDNFVGTGTDIAVTTQVQGKDQEVKRSTNIETTTIEQAKLFGRGLNITYKNSGGTTSNLSTEITNSTHDKQIASVSVLKSDGMRYSYDLPSYSKTQKQVLFSADINNQAGLDYTAYNLDVPISGSALDVDNSYLKLEDATTTPEFAQSWLLTSVVSADYVDATGNGLSDDDLGYWVKFNYKKSADKKWRQPYKGASFIEGNPGDKTDDKGFYMYGEKEIFYIESIETKTHIGKFYTSDREDAIEAPEELNNNYFLSGTAPAGYTKMQRLDKIELYAKDRSASGTFGDFKIKTVHFKYSYALCGGVWNNTGATVTEDAVNINAEKGKLTLERIYFTYEGSTRGELNPYIFNYGTTAADNPDYNPQNIDRWGCFKDASNEPVKYPINNICYTDQSDPNEPSPLVTNLAEPKMDVWSLKNIILPSKGTVEINYEADSYTHVENNAALRMFSYVGSENRHSYDYAERNVTSYTEDFLHSTANYTANKFKIYFNLEEALTSASHNVILDKYLDGGRLQKMYFRNYAWIWTKQDGTPVYDWVEGFANVVPGGTAGQDYGVEQKNGTGNYVIGWVTVEGEHLNAAVGFVHPYIAAAINHLQLHRKEVVFEYTPNNMSWQGQVLNYITAIGGSVNDIASAIAGFKTYAYIRNAGKKLRLNGWSMVRLADPDEKFGGGTRVKTISFSDNWENSGGLSQTYSQNYEYKMEDGTGSGVAYEPAQGDEESALTLPIEYSKSIPLGGKNEFALRTPLMKDYYPGQGVGYRRVVVKSDAPERAKTEDNTNLLKKSAAPITVYEFYSPKEFPVIFRQTDISNDKAITRPFVIPGIIGSFKKKIARSQGYVLELNDMAGKLRSVSSRTREISNPGGVYSDVPGSQFNRVEYVYQTEQAYNPGNANQLNNLANVITADGSYQTAYMGLNEDVFIDMNENKNINRTFNFGGNLELTSVIPFFAFSFFPIPQQFSETSMRTVVTNKIITRKGLLKETVVTSDQSKVKTEIVAYDYETGEPVLTKANNEFEDAIHSYSIPAHWKYPLMSGAYKNQNLVIGRQNSASASNIGVPSTGRINLNVSNSTFQNGTNNASDFFTPGDQVCLEFDDGSNPDIVINGHVMYTYDLSTIHAIYVVDMDGELLTNTYPSSVASKKINKITVVESGYRNFLDYDAGAVVAKGLTAIKKYDPLDHSNTFQSAAQTYTITQGNKILNASAVAFTDNASQFCGDCYGSVGDAGEVNPFKWKLKGVWKPYRSFTYITDRVGNTGTSGEMNTRDDGYFSAFDYFDWANLDQYPNQNTTWTESNTVTKFSNYGFTLEQKDALGNYSAGTFGYVLTLNTALATNAKYNEIAFKSFEDDLLVPKGTAACTTGNYWEHWQVIPSSYLSTTEAHTGKYSLVLSAGEDYTLLNSVGAVSTCTNYLDTYTTNDLGGNPDLPRLFTLDECACTGSFKPELNKKYVVSAWGKLRNANGNVLNYKDNSDLSIEVKLKLAGVTVQTNTFTSKGDLVEGWQRFYGEFTIPSSGVDGMEVIFHNNSDDPGSTARVAYFDDLRVHPYNASMMSYVYDPVSYKLVSTLDANNYASYINYDEQGSVSNAKKETSRGVKTLTGTRVYIRR
jgi:hypothetical protein